MTVASSGITDGGLVSRGHSALPSRPFMPSPTSPPPSYDIYVSTIGNDSNTGSELNPVRTIEYARDLAKEVSDRTAINIIIRHGIYTLTSPLLLTTEHSGSSACPITYKAHEDETVVISGGKDLDPTWVYYGDGIYYTDTTDTFRQLYVNGSRAQRAKTDWIRPYQWEPATPGETGSKDISGRLIVLNSDIASFGDLVGTEVQTKRKFMSDIMRVASVANDVNALDVPGPTDLYSAISFEEPEATIILVMGTSTYYRMYDGAACRFFNSLTFIRDENDWFLDVDAGRLYYKPPAGVDIDNLTFSVPNLDKVLNIVGDDVSDRIQHVQFHNLTFEQTAWEYPSENGYVQAQGGFVEDGPTLAVSRHFPPGGVSLKYADYITFNSCTIKNCGGSGLNLVADCDNVTVTRCLIQDIAAIGLVATDFSDIPWAKKPSADRTTIKNLTIYDNKILRTGRDYFTYGVSLNYLEDSSVSYNTIAYVPYSALSVGWRYYTVSASSIIVSHNEIHHYLEELGEGGGIYFLYPSPDSFVTDNYVHDMHSPINAMAAPVDGVWALGFWGVMHDDGTTSWHMDNNVVDTLQTIEGETNPPNDRLHTWWERSGNTYGTNYTTATGHEDIVNNAGATWTDEDESVGSITPADEEEPPFFLYWPQAIDVMSSDQFATAKATMLEMKELGATYAGFYCYLAANIDSPNMVSRVAELRATGMNLCAMVNDIYIQSGGEPVPDGTTHANGLDLRFFDTTGWAFDETTLPLKTSFCLDPSYDGHVWQDFLTYLSTSSTAWGMTADDYYTNDAEIWSHPEWQNKWAAGLKTPIKMITPSTRCGASPIANPIPTDAIAFGNYRAHWAARSEEVVAALKTNADTKVINYGEPPADAYAAQTLSAYWTPGTGDYTSCSFYILGDSDAVDDRLALSDRWAGAVAVVSFSYTGGVHSTFDPSLSYSAGKKFADAGIVGFWEWPGWGEAAMDLVNGVTPGTFATYADFLVYYKQHLVAFLSGFNS